MSGTTTYIGIDPGFKGAVAILAWDYTHVIDTPSTTVGKTKREYVLPQMIDILKDFKGKDVRVAIEKVHSMPKQGVASAFTFGKGYGLWLGILATLELPYEEVTPQKWQGVMMDGMQRGKDAARMRAMQEFPDFTDRLKFKSNDGRADALLIAEYRRRQG